MQRSNLDDYQELVWFMHNDAGAIGWRISKEDRNIVEYFYYIPAECEMVALPGIAIWFPMPIKDFVEVQMKANQERLFRGGFFPVPERTEFRHHWWAPIAAPYLKQKLDAMGYDFLPKTFIAIKRTGIEAV